MTEESKKHTLRDQILNFDDIQIEKLVVSEWGGIEIEVRGMSGKERAQFLRRITGGDGEVNIERFYPELIIATVFDPESGAKVFEGADRDVINTKSGAALEKIAQVAQRLSGLGSTDVEEAAGKSEETPRSDST
jgi:hypothetical protein